MIGSESGRCVPARYRADGIVWLPLMRISTCACPEESPAGLLRREMAALEDVLRDGAASTVVATHGNLLTLLLKHFDASVGFDEWQRLTNPDVYCVRFEVGVSSVDRLWWGEV